MPQITEKPPTPKQLLLDHLLRAEFDEGLRETMVNLRKQGMSWREVSRKVSEWTGHEVSHESIVNWANRWGLDAEASAA